jgi:hypothetical protein
VAASGFPEKFLVPGAERNAAGGGGSVTRVGSVPFQIFQADFKGGVLNLKVRQTRTFSPCSTNFSPECGIARNFEKLNNR